MSKSKVNVVYYGKLKSLFGGLNESQVRKSYSRRIYNSYKLYKDCVKDIGECKALADKYDVDVSSLLEEYFCS